jgi:hypothetical protein
MAARHHARMIPAEFARRLPRMFELADHLVRANGTMPRFGDVSPDQPVQELAAIPAIAHALGLLEHPPRFHKTTPLALYYLDSLPPAACAAPLGSRLYACAGFVFARNEAGMEFAAHSDPRTLHHTHGDAGCGTFELAWDGEILIREPGSYLDPGNRLSRFSRSGKAQNVTCLNGLAPVATPEDQQYLPAWYLDSGARNTWSRGADGSFQLRCEGFHRMRPGVTLCRTWGFGAQGQGYFEENVEGTGQVGFESYLCLGAGPWEALDWHAGSSTYRLRYERACGRAVEMVVDVPERAQVRIDRCRYLEEYGEWKEGRQLRLSGSFQLPLRWQTRWSVSTQEVPCRSN